MNKVFDILGSGVFWTAVGSISTLLALLVGVWRHLRKQNNARQTLDQRQVDNLTIINPSNPPLIDVQKPRQAYIKHLARQCNTLSGLDVGPRLTLDRLYISRELKTSEDTLPVPQDHLISEINNCIIIDGSAGLGKTTLLKSFIIKLCRDLSRMDSGLVPIFLSLGILGQQPKSYIHHTSLGEIAASQLFIDPPSDIAALLNDLHSKQQVVVFLDGLDEIPEEAKSDIKQWIDRLLNSLSHRQIVITGRPYSDNISVERCNLYSITEFTDDVKERFIRTWFAAIQKPESGESLLLSLHDEQRFSRVLGNPMFLAIICMNFEARKAVAINPGEMLSIFVSILLKEWDRSRGVVRSLNNSLNVVPLYIELEVLNKAAWFLSEKNALSVSERNLYKIARQAITKDKIDVSPQKTIDEICTVSGILIRDKSFGYRFCHQVFQEYFVARELCIRYFDVRSSKTAKEWIAKKGHEERNANITGFLNDLIYIKTAGREV